MFYTKVIMIIIILYREQLSVRMLLPEVSELLQDEESQVRFAALKTFIDFIPISSRGTLFTDCHVLLHYMLQCVTFDGIHHVKKIGRSVKPAH